MSQIPKNNIQKFVKGGSPTTYQEYQRRKSEIDSKNLENRAKHDADKIKINGVDRSRKELVYALRSWASTGSSDLLRRGYGKNTQNLSSDYESFLNALSNGDIESIDSNADGGFTFRGRNGQGFTISDANVSDYISRAVRSNMHYAKEKGDYKDEEVEKIKVSWDPRAVVKERIYPSGFTPERYKNATIQQRTQDIIDALTHGSFRQTLTDYFNPDNDRSAFELSEEGLPFVSITELNELIERLKSKGVWDESEQMLDRKYGTFIRNYIHGNIADEQSQQQETSSSDPSDDRLARLKTWQNANPGQNITNLPDFTYGKVHYTVDSQGRIVDDKGNLFVGYLNPDEFQNPASLGGAKLGYYNQGKYIGGNAEAMKIIDAFNKLNSSVPLNENDRPFYNWYINSSIKTGRDRLRMSPTITIPKADYDYYNRTREYLWGQNVKDRHQIENNSHMINNSKLEGAKLITSHLLDAQGNPTGELYAEKNYQGKSMLVLSDNSVIKGTIVFNAGRMFLIPEGGTEADAILLNDNVQGIDEDSRVDLTDDERDRITDILAALNPNYTFNQNKSGYSIYANTPSRYQWGGVLHDASKKSRSNARIIGGTESFKEFTEEDWADIVALGADLFGFGSSFVPGVGNIAGAISGLVSTGATAYGDFSTGNENAWNNLALNLGMDLATLLPVVGTGARAGRIAKGITKLTPTLTRLFNILGAYDAITAIDDIKKDGLTADNARRLLNGLNAIKNVGFSQIGKYRLTSKTTPTTDNVAHIEVKANGKTHVLDNISSKEAKDWSKLSKGGLRDKLQGKLRSKLESEYRAKGEDPTSDNVKKAIDDAVEDLSFNSKWFGIKSDTKIHQSKVKSERQLKPEVVQKIYDGKLGYWDDILLKHNSAYLPKNLGTKGQLGDLIWEIHPQSGVRRGTGMNPFKSKNAPEVKTSSSSRSSASEPVVIPPATDESIVILPASEPTVIHGENPLAKMHLETRKLGMALDRIAAEEAGIYTGRKTLRTMTKRAEKATDPMHPVVESITQSRWNNRTQAKKDPKKNRKIKETISEVETFKTLEDNIKAWNRHYAGSLSNVKNRIRQAQNAIDSKDFDRATEHVVRAMEINKGLPESKSQIKRLKELEAHILKNLDNTTSKTKGSNKNQKKSDVNKNKHKKHNVTPSKKGVNNADRRLDVDNKTRGKESYGGVDRPSGRLKYYKIRKGLTGIKLSDYDPSPLSIGGGSGFAGLEKSNDQFLNKIREETEKITSSYYNSEIPTFNNKLNYYTSSFKSFNYNPPSLNDLSKQLRNMGDSWKRDTKIKDPKQELKYPFPLTSLVSGISYADRVKTNNRIFKTLKNETKPVILDTPRDINYTIQGNEGVRSQYHHASRNTRNHLLTPLTSDMNSWLGYSLAVNKQANDYALQGDLANEQALQQSREKALQVQSQNQQRREAVAAQNRQSLTNWQNSIAQAKAQKIAANSNVKDTFLHDITVQAKQYFGVLQAQKVQNNKKVEKLKEDILQAKNKQTIYGGDKTSTNYLQAVADEQNLTNELNEYLRTLQYPTIL